ncbi:MAG: hypothetical protein JNK15_09440 [Planctomycetes bacterium]|nr:hypothetical protein [Planctomycetota bacterium]
MPSAILASVTAQPTTCITAGGDRRGLHSIRVDDQWRIVFRWTADGPAEVRLVDNH